MKKYTVARIAIDESGEWNLQYVYQDLDTKGRWFSVDSKKLNQLTNLLEMQRNFYIENLKERE